MAKPKLAPEDIAALLAVTPKEDIRRAALREECARSLHAFVRRFWRAVEPVAPFVDGEWLHALCLHLEAITAGKLKRLLVNCPPGFCKSLIVNVFWPAWEWGPKRHASYRYVSASYSQALTERDNTRFQQVLLFPLYQELWGDLFSVNESKIKCSNTKTGWKFATSVGGIGTGERGDRVIIDDPNNILDVESDAILETTNRWLTEIMPSRLNDPARSAIVVIQQRSGERDATGTLMENEFSDWTHLCVPMRYDPTRHCQTSIGWEDWRTEEGELAWPERFPEHVVSRLEKEIGEFATAGQLQQMPVPRGGGIIGVDSWQMWPPRDDGSGEGWVPQVDAAGRHVLRPDGTPAMRTIFPNWVYLLVSVDTALTEKQENDWSACTVWGVWEDRSASMKLMLVEAWRDRLRLRPLVNRIIETCRRRKADLLLIEDKANGHAVLDEVRRLVADGEWTTRLFNPKRQDKAARMQAVEPLFTGGLVYAPNRKWARMVIDEVSMVPKGKHDDLADTTTQALLYLRQRGFARLSNEKDSEAPPFRSLVGGPPSIAAAYGLATV